jgi:hypothetical protein
MKTRIDDRPFARTLPLLLAATLGLALPAADGWASPAADSGKPAAREQTAKTQTSKNGKAAAAIRPVLDDAARQEIGVVVQKLSPETQATLNRLSDAMRQEDRAIDNTLRDEEEEAFADIGMLWAAAVERSGTIRYAIEKLSRRDATGKPVANDTFSRRMLQSLVHLGGVAGTMWSGTPAGMIGSNMIQGLMTGNPQDSALSRVTDADMVILAKEVDNLQTRLITLYYNYRHARERLTLRHEAGTTLAKYYDHAAESPDGTTAALQPLMQSLEESARQDERNAQQAFNSARTDLGLLVGPEAMAALDQSMEKSKSARTAAGPSEPNSQPTAERTISQNAAPEK